MLQVYFCSLSMRYTSSILQEIFLPITIEPSSMVLQLKAAGGILGWHFDFNELY